MIEMGGVEAVAFDVLGTLVDEHGGLRAEIRAAVPGAGDAYVGELLDLWMRHVDVEHERIKRGERAYANSEIIDGEAARVVAGEAGVSDPAAIARLATAGQRLPAWNDTVAGLERLARHLPVIALSNASRTALLRLSVHAGLRWHHALSGETVAAYKPASAVYQLAIDTAGCRPDRVLMVAAHAWDLRGAQAAGMRAAYVQRPVGEPPKNSDTFDGQFGTFGELVTALTTE